MVNHEELLNYLSEMGTIDLDSLQKQFEMNERKKYLAMHPYAKWKDKNGIWHTYLPDAEKGRIPRKRKTEEEIDNLIIAYWRGKMENPTIKEIFTEWNDRRLELEKISKATYLRYNQCFERHYGEFGTYRIKDITPDDLTNFLEEEIPRCKLSAKAFSNLKGITKGFMKRAKKRKLISWNIEEVLYDLDVSESEFKKVVKEDYEEVFSEDEMPIMINYLIQHMDPKNLAILLIFVTGIRVGECVALKNVVWGDNFFQIVRTETRYIEDEHYVFEIKEFPKSEAGVRTVVVPNDYFWLCEKIRSLNPTGEYIFLDRHGKRLTTRHIRDRLRYICKKLNIYNKSSNKIRKTYGSILLDYNIDERLVREQMGHSGIAVTENHYHRNRRKINKKAEILSQIPDFTLSYPTFDSIS